MEALAALPNVYMKLSFWNYTDPYNQHEDFVTNSALDLIRLFTP